MIPYLFNESLVGGDIVECTVEVSDDEDVGNQQSASVTIINTPPEIISVNILANDYNTSSLLSCESEIFDVDSDEIDLTYTWQILSGGSFKDIEYYGSELQLEPNMIQPNELLYCFVTASDSTDTTQSSTFVSLENRPPVIETLLIEPSTGVRPGVQLICDAEVSEPDLQDIEITYKWYQINQDQTSRTFISADQELLLTTDNAVKGEFIECELSVVDSLGLDAMQTTQVEVRNTTPTLDVVGLIPTNPTGADNIECSGLASDIDGDSIEYNYSWTVNGILYPEPVIPSLFTEVLVAGDIVECTVEVSDGEDIGNSLSTSVTVINTAPKIENVTLSPDPIYTNDLVTATVDAYDSDGDTPLIYFQWYVDGIEVKSGLGGTLDGVDYFDKEQEILVVAYADDGIDQSFLVPSTPILVQNSPPIPPEVNLGGEYSSDTDDLHCNITTPSIDEDGDDISYTTSWFLNGEGYLGPVEDNFNQGDSVLGFFTNPGEVWECTVQASDGSSITEEITSSTLLTACTVQNYYGIYNDLSDLTEISDCWELGRANSLETSNLLSLTTYIQDEGWNTLAFDKDNFNNIDPNTPGTFISEWDYFGHGVPSAFTSTSHEAILSNTIKDGVTQEYYLGTRCVNMFSWSCQGRYLFLPDESIAIHPGDQKVFLRWLAPLNGTCEVDILAIGSEYIPAGGFGISGYQTSTTAHLMHNHVSIQSIDITEYSEQYPLTEEINVQGGDIIDIVVEGNQSLSEWTGITGGITCGFNSENE